MTDGAPGGSAIAPPSGRVTLTVDGKSFSKWTRVEVTRDLREIAGSFRLEYVDEGRAAQSLPDMIAVPPYFRIIRAGMPCTVAIDGETVLTGYIDTTTVDWQGNALTAMVEGRDRTGDLVDCAAAPNGPAEFSGVDLLHVASIICAPFNISVRADVDLGAPFARLSMHPHETALAFLEKAARQRAVLLVSDGQGGLLLTRGGSTPAPASLTRPGNIQGGAARESWRGRHSDYFVKGQTDSRAMRGGQPAALDSSVTPDGTDSTPASATQTEASTVLTTGHAVDPEITRWRPTVRITRTQSGMSTTTEQAFWALRVARGEGSELRYTVLDWRAGPQSALWLPNQVVTVTDPYADIDKPMLIAGVIYAEGEQGLVTQIRVAGRTAFDRINEADRRRQRTTKNAVSKPLDSSVAPPSP